MKSPYNVDWHTKETEEVLVSVHKGELSYLEASQLLNTSTAAVGFHLGEYRKKHNLAARRQMKQSKRAMPTPSPEETGLPSLAMPEAFGDYQQAAQDLLEAAMKFAAAVLQRTEQKLVRDNAELKRENKRLAEENRDLRANVGALERAFASGVLKRADVRVVHSTERDK